MLGKRYRSSGKPLLSLNDLQIQTKLQVEQKIRNGVYELETAPCIVCNSTTFEPLAEKDRYGFTLSVVVCRKCGLVQLNPRMRQDAYDQFFREEYRQLYVGAPKPTSTYFQQEYNRGNRIDVFLREALGPVDYTGMRVLDIGCGAGAVLHYFREKGAITCGLDLGGEYVRYGRDNFGLNLVEGTIDVLETDQTFDLIIYSHVIQHMTDPLTQVSKAMKHLNDNGQIYIRVPGIKNLTIIYKGDFLRNLQNAHVYYFTLLSVTNLMAKAHCSLIYGNEEVRALYRKQPDSRKRTKLNNEYPDIVNYIQDLELKRKLGFPLIRQLKQKMIHLIIVLLKAVKVYSVLKRIKNTFLSR